MSIDEVMDHDMRALMFFILSRFCMPVLFKKDGKELSSGAGRRFWCEGACLMFIPLFLSGLKTAGETVKCSLLTMFLFVWLCGFKAELVRVVSCLAFFLLRGIV